MSPRAFRQTAHWFVVPGRKFVAWDPCHRSSASLRSLCMGKANRKGLEGIHVLVLDFDADVCARVRTILEPLGVLVTVATAAGAAATTIIVDLILCDLELVEATGHVLLTTLRNKHHRHGRPAPAIAFVTGGTPDARVGAAGFQAYIKKPIEPHELRMAVWHHRPPVSPPSPC